MSRSSCGLAIGTAMRLARLCLGFALTQITSLRSVASRAETAGQARRGGADDLDLGHAAHQVRAIVDMHRLHPGRIAQRLTLALALAREQHA